MKHLLIIDNAQYGLGYDSSPATGSLNLRACITCNDIFSLSVRYLYTCIISIT